ncbi:MAG: ABC transporter permease [Synergistales bacterium]|nr:ABC transporter permease [Synergistales bacterium]MDY6401524.1 ABC transporter permease [Synergistales bacterium]MDY6404631.1 ABC transporter permease [Synergistales bacterium]MDY6410534.1 ABC transporter permease [Synergistales bacterium]MDY6413770.1 ABC transporter permease [Synergistales bacterium]
MFEIFRTAIRSLFANRTRSILTMLGIIIGVGAVITLVAIGNGASSQMQGLMDSFGSNLIIVMPAPPNTTGARGAAGSGMNLTLADSTAIAGEGFSVLRTAPEVNGSAQVIYGNNNWSTSITGCTPDILPVRMWEIGTGVFFSDSEVRSGAKVCVIGATVAKELFGYTDPVDSTIRIRNIPFRVCGVMKAKGASSFGEDQDDFVLVPITTAQRRLFRMGTRVDTVRRVNVQAKSRELLDTAKEEVTSILRQRHKLTEGVENDFQIRDLTQSLENAASMANIMSLLLGSIASISLIVGGIGIMNIMLVSVSERTREIGIRMAIGARPSNVRMQFLTEAVVLSILGGIIGIIIGFVISSAASSFLAFNAIVSMNSVFIAVGFSAAVGVFFGFWPAWKASNLDPIVALRAE